MANDNHLFSVTCYNVTMQKQDYYNEFFELGQQKINFSFFELSLPDDDPVYTLKKVMEELDFSGLLANCSDKGRIGYNPIMMYAVVTYANMRGVRAVVRIVELCERDLAFIWLTKGQKPKRDAFYELKNKKLTADVLDALNYHLAGLLDTADSVYQKYNALIDENEYGIKYDIPHAHMFVIEGMEKVRDVIEKNRTRKLTKHKKLSNNTIIEIDNCSPLEILKLQKNLMQIAEQEHITFVYGK